VRSGREEQPMLEPFGQLTHGPGELGINGILRAGRRSGVRAFQLRWPARLKAEG
jgi:hypothetical protein